MTQDKMRRIITACVSAATVLLVFLLSFLIYQWITIAKKNERIDQINENIAYWEEQIENAETEKERFESQQWLELELQKLELLKGK